MNIAGKDSQRLVKQIPANGSETVTCLGDKLFVESASLPFKLQPGSGNESDAKSGFKLNRGGDTFNRLVIKNPNAVAIDVVIWVGMAEVDFLFPAIPATAPVSTVGEFAGAVTVSTAGVITAGSEYLVTIPGIATNHARYADNGIPVGSRRRQIVVTNVTAVDFIVTDENDNILFRFGNPSGAASHFTWESDATFKIACRSGTQPYYVGELFYL
jgi:hypothetical protein